MQRLDKIQDFLSLLSAVGAQDTGDIFLTIKGNLRKLAGAVVQSTGDRQTPLWEATLVSGVSGSGPVCVTINLEPYSTLSSSRSILKITGLEFNSSRVKLCNLLYLLTMNQPANSGLVIEMTQEDLADILGISRVHLTRELTELRRMGVLTTTRGRLTITDLPALAGLCTDETV